MSFRSALEVTPLGDKYIRVQQTLEKSGTATLNLLESEARKLYDELGLILNSKNKSDEIELVCRCPNEDFDGMDLQMAINWVADQRGKDLFDYEDKGRHAAKILNCLAAKYNEQLPPNVQIKVE